MTETAKDGAIAQLEEPDYVPLTPVIGKDMVLWFDHAQRGEGNKRDPQHPDFSGIPAIVTKIEREGVVSLTVLKPNYHGTFCVKGCRHIDDPEHGPDKPYTRNSGGWDFAGPVRKEHKEPFLKKERARQAAMAEANKKK